MKKIDRILFSIYFRKKFILIPKMCIKFHCPNMLPKTKKISLLHNQIFLLIELKTKSSNRNNIQTFNIFKFNDYRLIFFKISLFESKKEIMKYQHWWRNTFTDLFGLFLHCVYVLCLCFFMFHHNNNILKRWKFVFENFNT